MENSNEDSNAEDRNTENINEDSNAEEAMRMIAALRLPLTCQAFLHQALNEDAPLIANLQQVQHHTHYAGKRVKKK